LHFTRKVPDSWYNAVVILLHKKGDKEDIRNYRPISLLPVMYNIFTRILTNRLEGDLEKMQPKAQAGFRTGYSTMDHIHVLREITERYMEHEQSLCLAFIDYEKAFDSVYITSVLGALINQGIDKAYIE